MSLFKLGKTFNYWNIIQIFRGLDFEHAMPMIIANILQIATY